MNAMQWLAEHGTQIIALGFAARAMMSARARRDAASADAIEELREAHRACTERTEELSERVALAERAAEAAATKATEQERHAVALDRELRELRAEIRR